MAAGLLLAVGAGTVLFGVHPNNWVYRSGCTLPTAALNPEAGFWMR